MFIQKSCGLKRTWNS